MTEGKTQNRFSLMSSIVIFQYRLTTVEFSCLSKNQNEESQQHLFVRLIYILSIISDLVLCDWLLSFHTLVIRCNYLYAAANMRVRTISTAYALRNVHAKCTSYRHSRLHVSLEKRFKIIFRISSIVCAVEPQLIQDCNLPNSY